MDEKNGNRIAGKKKPREFFQNDVSGPKQTSKLDEFSEYNLLRLDGLQETCNHLLRDNFTI